MLITLILLGWLGLCAGSFVNALVWRVHEQSKPQKAKSRDLSILHGRSMCPNCGHQLAGRDLLPVLSWVMLGGRCRYCQKPISRQYPLVELTGALIFIASYLFWPLQVHGTDQWLLLTTWLAVSVGLLALAVYDFKWMLLPSRILYPTLAVAAAGRLGYLLIGFEGKPRALAAWIASIAVTSGVFWILFMVSQGRWIGYGDVRLGLITGTILADPAKAFLMILLASVLGTLFAVPGLLSGGKTATSKLPYGPFLILATAIALLFGGSLIDWYSQLLIP